MDAPTKKRSAWRHTEVEVILAIKKLGACTDHQIAKELGIGHKWVGQKRRVLYDAGRIYISGYTKTALQGPSRVLYSWKYDNEEDEPPPKPMSPTKKTNNYRARIKQKKLLQLMKGINHVAN